MEAGIRYLRAAFKGEPVPDGYQGTPLPVTPQPAQNGHLPIYMGGTSEAALERVARLADGFLAETNVDTVRTLTDQWKRLKPHLERHGHDITSFPVIASTRMWVSDDPERDWETILAPALAYQAQVYARMGTDAGQPQPPKMDPQTLRRTGLLIDTPEHVVRMIREMQTSAPLMEICLWSHLPGVSHEVVMAHLERVSKQVLPTFSAKEA
jgi:alkanesulfonate monooxygenase SsuD/methylene tetrahydromethanopterin reductase-like flavin-dependent oxidoreductase (luciferase family)